MSCNYDFDRVAEAWQRWLPVVQRGAAAVSERLIVLARIGAARFAAEDGSIRITNRALIVSATNP